jgi:hypothetical protein
MTDRLIMIALWLFVPGVLFLIETVIGRRLKRRERDGR